jgi:glyoxylase-like metal-dependent hydrolase (beta-lactamase superfamily II)
MQRSGLDPEMVHAIVVSHFHPEHVGAVEEFPHAEIVCDQREAEHGLESPDYNYVRREYDDVTRWRQLDFSHGVAWGPFAAAVDLFGDGSVLIVSTPGHTPGHVSVLVNLPSGPVLLAGDMAWTELNLDTATIGLPFVSSDGPAARQSLGQLLRFRADNPRVLIVPGHDLAPLRRSQRPDVVLHAFARR